MALLSLVAKLGLDKTGFEQGLSKAGKQASQFGSSLKTTLAGAFGATAMIAFAKGIADTTGRIKDLSEQFGVTTDDVQNIDYAMKQSGMSFEDFGAAMNKLGPARREAALGNEELAATFAKFGVSAEDLQNPLLSNKDILMKVAEAMRGTNVTAADQAAIMDLLGPKAAKLANVLAGLDGFQAPSLFSEDDIAMIDQMSKEFELFYRDLQISGVETGKFLMDTFNDVYTFITTLFGELASKWKDIFTFKVDVVTAVSDAVNKAMDEAGQQAAQRDEDRANAKEQRDKDRAEAKRKREEDLKNAGPLFKDKAVNDKTDLKQETFGKGLEMRSTDQLGRIGAFSGGPSNNIVGQLKKNTETLTEIRNVLAVRGIVIREL
jgi:phage-related protein